MREPHDPEHPRLDDTVSITRISPSDRSKLSEPYSISSEPPRTWYCSLEGVAAGLRLRIEDCDNCFRADYPYYRLCGKHYRETQEEASVGPVLVIVCERHGLSIIRDEPLMLWRCRIDWCWSELTDEAFRRMLPECVDWSQVEPVIIR